ncbi:class I SAM-dependent methyltransferase [Kordiimonas aestuarii]|uniref:class I SAM-dependent methyltransferase n=1 Tax=Kordiimonas aestuarii TaxID=1005925 RepID=UPI0021D283E2|nr:class I SAM-dependent methyltransferase [Kordiimonas aestuarii]
MSDRARMVHEGPTLGSREGYSVIECSSCGYRHLMPMPTDKEIENFYKEEFYQNERADYLKEADEDYRWKRVEMIRRLAKAEELLPAVSRSALDVGCGPGDFLAVAKERGWLVKGIEPSDMAAEHARGRGLDVDTGFFSAQTADALGQYDLVHMGEVLEHVARPREVLSLAHKCLKPGGILCVSTPNDFNGFQKVVANALERPKWWILPHHHLNYFSCTSLEKLFGEEGFEPVHRTTNFPMELFLLMGQNYVGNAPLGREMHGWRKNLDITLYEDAPELLETFYECLANADLGRLAIVFARKSA